MLEPTARRLPPGAADDLASARNLPGRAICRLPAALPSREPIGQVREPEEDLMLCTVPH